MDKIIQYSNLSSSSLSVSNSIDSLLKIVEDIKCQCDELCNSEIWSGVTATAFSSTVQNLSKYAETNVLNFKNTNEYKNVVIESFITVENNNMSKYIV